MLNSKKIKEAKKVEKDIETKLQFFCDKWMQKEEDGDGDYDKIVELTEEKIKEIGGEQIVADWKESEDVIGFLCNVIRSMGGYVAENPMWKYSDSFALIAFTTKPKFPEDKKSKAKVE